LLCLLQTIIELLATASRPRGPDVLGFDDRVHYLVLNVRYFDATVKVPSELLRRAADNDVPRNGTRYGYNY
jgi:hypothetical protein